MSLAIKRFCQQKGYPLTLQKFYDLTPVWTQFPDNVGYQVCLSIAAADLLTICHYKDGGLDIPLSPQILIDHCEDCTNDKQVFDYMSNYGLTTVRDYPFIGMKHSHPVQSPYQDAKIYKLPDAEFYLSTVIALPDLSPQVGQRIVQTLFDQNLPLLGSFIVTGDSNFANWKPSDPPYCPNDVTVKDNHAVVIVGYDFSSRDSKDHCFIFKNSYGTDWGMRAMGELRWVTFEDCGFLSLT